MIDIGYWIKETRPQPDAVGVPADTVISISFTQEINRHTLNARNVLILNASQGGKLVSDRFLFHYETDDRTLHIYLKKDETPPDPGSRIEVILTGRIANYRNEQMRVPFHLCFTTQ